MLHARGYGGALEVAKPNTYQLGKAVLVFFPDPTEGAGGTTTWSWEIYNVTDSAIVDSDSSVDSGTEGNAIKVELDSSYATGKLYRVRIWNAAAQLRSEWYFVVFDATFGTVGPTNIAAINDAITRIAGLQGHNQKVTIVSQEFGVPTEVLIEVYDGDPDNSGSSVIARYRQKKFLDATQRVSGEVSAAEQ